MFAIPTWAEEISVEQKRGILIVTGKNHYAVPRENAAVEADLLKQSLPSVRWLQDDDRRKKPPHVEFANATTDAKLVEFVRKWGPIDPERASMLAKEPKPMPPEGGPEGGVTVTTSKDGIKVVVRQNGRTQKWFFPGVRIRYRVDVPDGYDIVVRQSLAALRRQQEIFSAAARLIAEIQSNEPDPERIFKYCAQTAMTMDDRESFFDDAEALLLGSKRSLASAVSQLAQPYLCSVLNDFSPRVYPTSAGPIELLPLDTTNLGHGIKPVLYGMLRLEYLRKDRQGLGVCPRCNEVFAKERRGAVFCDKKCSELERGNNYYRDRGRDRRRQRAAESKALAPSIGKGSSKTGGN